MDDEDRTWSRLQRNLVIGAAVGATAGIVVGVIIGAIVFSRSGAIAASALAGAIGIGGIGAFWGLLFAHLFLIPITLAAAPSATADHLDDALGAIGVDADFVGTVRHRVVPGTSALFLLDTTSPPMTGTWPPTDAVHLADLRLSPEQSDRLHAGFDDE